MRYHSQDLKKEERSNRIYHKRGWLYVGKDSRTVLDWEISVPGHSFGANLALNHYGDTAVGLNISPKLFSLHLGIENNWLYNFLQYITRRTDQKYTNGREIGFWFMEWNLHLKLWSDPMEWRSSDFKFQNLHVNLLDLLLGNKKYKSEVIKEESIEVYLPEKTYKGKGKYEVYTHSRPRWFDKVYHRVSIEVEEGVPHPGKGTMSYNCDEDALHSYSSEGKSIEEGIGKFIGQVLWYRKNYPM